MDKSFPAFLSRNNEDGASFKVNSSFEAACRRHRFDGEGCSYVTRQQTLGREERAAWRDAEKMQAQADVELTNIQAEADRAEAD